MMSCRNKWSMHEIWLITRRKKFPSVAHKSINRSRLFSTTRSKQLQVSLHFKTWFSTCSRKTIFNTSPMFQLESTRDLSAKTGSISGSRMPIARLTRSQMNQTSLNVSRLTNMSELPKSELSKTNQFKRLISNFWVINGPYSNVVNKKLMTTIRIYAQALAMKTFIQCALR